jgi:GTPase SAR1 family protein
LKIPFFEMSAKTGENVREGFITLLREIVRTSTKELSGGAKEKEEEPPKPVTKKRKGLFRFFGS